MFAIKFATFLLVGLVFSIGASYYASQHRIAEPANQLADDPDDARRLDTSHWARNTVYGVFFPAYAFLGFLLFGSNIHKWWYRNRMIGGLVLVSCLTTGCWRPFEPVKLETIGTNEEGFLIPLRGDGKKQEQTSTEDYLKTKLVYTKQVQLQQQWVPKGYETLFPNGQWEDAEKLIKMDKSPITREWTADPNSGTSDKNQAVWVMTADQVEFSTGWTITARIATRDDAVKFLHNYPNGSLKEVLDSEVRGKLQATFGFEVTDLPMDELRKHATPHIQKTVDTVTTFFADRGLTITNLGITGGFVYKDPSIGKMMVQVLNAEQEKSIAAAATAAQDEKNKKTILEATGKANAVITEQKAVADGIRLVADAKAYEIEQAQKDIATYMSLMRLDYDRKRVERWDGKFPVYFLGGQNPDMLLNLPSLPPK